MGSYARIHEIYEQRNPARFRAFLAASRGGAAGSSKDQSKGEGFFDPSSSSSYTQGGASVGAGGGNGSSSLSRSPRFSHQLDGSGTSNQPSKEEVNARDRWGRTVLHLVASEEQDADHHQHHRLLDYLDPLLACPTVNVNLQDRENGWTALHRAVYAGNLVAARRILQHPDTDTHIRDLEGLTAFDLLNSTLLGTNPLDLLDNLEQEEQAYPRRELVTWGANRNFVLGLQGDSDRTFPERVNLEKIPQASTTSQKVDAAEEEEDSDDDYGVPADRRKFAAVYNPFEPISVRKIAMEKLHSGLLTDEKKGNFRVCGFGSTTGRLGHSSPHPQFAFEPLRDFGHHRVVDFAFGPDHTILCTDKGDAWTFGANTFSVLGYPVDTVAPVRPGLIEEPAQPTPKRLVGILKKEFVLGVAASRYHSAVFTNDSLFTWGKNNGQLGYPSNATPLQHTPRKVTSLQVPIKQMCATEVATVCLLEGGEVFVLHRDGHFKISFPMTRFPSAMQVYRPLPRPNITKVAGSGTSFIALSDQGDVFSWYLDNPSLEAPTAVPSSGRDIKPTRIWEDRKTFTAVSDACIAGDTILLCTRSGHVYVRARKKELTTVKGFELRNTVGHASGSQAAAASNNKRNQFKFTKVANLQRVVSVAVSPSGGFGAIRSDAPLLKIPEVGQTLPESLLDILPHYRRLRSQNEEYRIPTSSRRRSPSFELHSLDGPEGDENDDDDADETMERDGLALERILPVLQRWDSTWSIPTGGADLLLVAGDSGAKIPVHSIVLAARSEIIASAIASGKPENGVFFSQSGTPSLSIPGCSHATALLLVHYLYGDDIPALYDPRLFHKLRTTMQGLKLEVGQIKSELLQLASTLHLSDLRQALKTYGKAVPAPTLSRDFGSLLKDSSSSDVVLEVDDGMEEIRCHSVVLRARCPFFSAMFDDPDWHASRRQVAGAGDTDEDSHGTSSDHGLPVIRVDLRHIRSDVLSLVLRHIYMEQGESLFRNMDFARADDKIDFVMLVLAAANELLLDRLKAVCSAIIRPLVNIHTVCAILTDAIFYEAASLQECCMQYICCNIEIMLEQHLLDILPSSAVARLARFCMRRQLDRLPRTRRSVATLAELQSKHADWIKELDVPRATGSYRRFSQSAAAARQAAAFKSPKLSPTMISASSLRLSPNNLSSSGPYMLSPPRQQASGSIATASGAHTRIQRPPSPAITASPGPSPLVEATHVDDASTFDMDDLSLEETSTHNDQSRGMPTPSRADSESDKRSGGHARAPWQTVSTTPARTNTHNLRDIMAQASSSPSGKVSSGPTIGVRTTSNGGAPPQGTPSPVTSSLKLSQKDRKKQQQQQNSSAQASPHVPAWSTLRAGAGTTTPSPQSTMIGASVASVTAAASTAPWRPSAPPAAWKPPEPQVRPSLLSIQSSQSTTPGAVADGNSQSALGRRPGFATPSHPTRRVVSEGVDSSRVRPGITSPPLSSAGNSARGSGQSPHATSSPAPQQQQQPQNAASAVGAPVITPVRQTAKRNPSSSSGGIYKFGGGSGPPETRSHDTPWVSYTSTVPIVDSSLWSAPAATSSSSSTGGRGDAGGGPSFANIQNLQATEREALRVKKGTMSLAEIQEEENRQREEAQFLAWFEEESKRTQTELGLVQVRPQPKGKKNSQKQRQQQQQQQHDHGNNVSSPSSTRGEGKGGERGGRGEGRGRGGRGGRGAGRGGAPSADVGGRRGSANITDLAQSSQPARIDD